MKKKLTILVFSLLLAVGWTNVAQAQLKNEYSTKGYVKAAPVNKAKSGPVAKQELMELPFLNKGIRTNFGQQTDNPVVPKRAPMHRAPMRAENTITAKATLSHDEAEAITYIWRDANGNVQPPAKLTDPASDSYQIAYLLGTTYMNPAVPGLKYSAVYDMDNPYTNIEFGWDIPNNPRWPSEFVGPAASSSTTTKTWSWVGADNGTTLPTGWTLTDPTYSSIVSNGDGTWYIGIDPDNYTAQSITIPASVFTGYSTVTVTIRAKMDSGISGKTISVNGDSKSLTNTLANYTWYDVSTANGILIVPTDGYVGFASIVITGTSTSSVTGLGLTIAAPDSTAINTITVYNQNNTAVVSWNAVTAYQNGEYNSNGYFTIPGWSCSQYFWVLSSNGYVSGVYGYLYDNHIHIPASYFTGCTSLRVVINAYGDGGGERLVVNGVEKKMTTSATNYTWNITDLSAPNGTVIPPDENGYTIFLVKVNDNVPAAMHSTYTYAWDNANNTWTSASLIDWLDTYIDEVQLLTDGTRLNEDTPDAGTRFGSLESSTSPQMAPTYDMYEEFSPTSTDNGADITDFYSKLFYGNSYNVIHDCRGMNYFQHYFTMSGLAGDEHRSMTNLIFWIPDNRGEYGQRNYNEEYLPHVGLYNITLEAEAEQVAQNYVVGNRNYKVTCDWVSTLNSILDFDIDQDYELWIYTYDNEGNPVAQEKVMDLIPDADGLIHNDTEHFYYVEQKPESYTIVYRIKGWPKDANNSPGKDPNGTFFALSNLAPVLIPGYEDFLSLGVDHYESDFVIDGNPEYAEHNYYRNFLTVDNQNPDNPLTPQRIVNGEDEYELYRYDPENLDDQNQPIMTKAADLLLSVEDNKVKYLIDYANQFYVDEANLVHVDDNGVSHNITGYTDPDALGYPTYGEIANISEGGSVTPTPTPATQTVANGTTTSNTIPANGYYQDYGYRVQMIYPADMLNMVQGDELNSITFYPSAGLKFYGSTVKLSVGSTSNSSFTSTSMITSGLTQVASIRVTAANTSATEWTFTFDQPYTYDGGNLVVQVQCQGYNNDGTSGQYDSSNNRTTFYGQNQSANQSLYSTGNSGNNTTGTRSQFLPKTKFDYMTSGGNTGYTLLNDFLDNSTYTQVGQVVFPLPWKSIQVKLQDESAGTSNGFFLIQNGGKLRFIMPAGYNNASLKFVIHSADVTSNYLDGTFTLSSSTGDTQTITVPSGSSTWADRDYEAIFTGMSSGDVITITGTHTVDGELYGYSPDFKYIHVYVQGGNDGISMSTALNLDAIKFVDQFKASTKDDTHAKFYKYVLKSVNSDEESGRPEIPVKHTNSKVHGFYSLNEINGDTVATLFDKNVMNAEVNMTLSRDQEVYYYTLDRKPSNVTNAPWEPISKLQIRTDDSYQEMLDKLTQYDDQICNPPAVTTPPTPWNVERYDNYNVVPDNSYNSFMSYVPIIWTHGDQKNRRIKWDTEQKHNSYGAPIWKTGVAEVTLTHATAERQDDNVGSTKWTYGGEDCSLYILDNIEAVAKMPTANNVKYVPYMFRIFVKSENHKLRGYRYVAADVDPDKPGEHYEGDVIADTDLKCVWSGFVNDPNNANYGVTISEGEDNGAKTYTFNKVKVDRSEADGEWDKNKENAIFASLVDIIQGEKPDWFIDPSDLTIMVRFYYIVEGFDASVPESMRGEGDDPAGYGVENGRSADPWTAINDVFFNSTVESVTYVNALGMTSDKPFDGVNIVITRYTNGRTITQKVVR